MFEILQDSIRVDSPLPGGVAASLRLFFDVPRWIQVSVAVVVGLAGIGLLALAVRNRAQIISWLMNRSVAVKAAIVVVLGVVLLATTAVGTVSWRYMQHENEFCTGCHVMSDAYQRFNASEHSELQCHDCHQQSMYANARQLVLWVIERPEHIGDHAPVANEICQQCHVTDQPERWQRIAATAGHRTHLESDSIALDSIMCVTCHGVEVHRFAPVRETCTQSGCHAGQEITIASMADQTSLHCVACHEFTAEIPDLADQRDATGALTPTMEQCFGCHEMNQVLADFDPDIEPHGGSCGSCHNAHDQTEPAEAANSCTTSGCHDNWRTEPFHVGTLHRRIGSEASQCMTCHVAHSASVDASDCIACHDRVVAAPETPEARRRRLQSIRDELPSVIR